MFTTAGSDKKLAACLRLGAEVGINYNEKDFAWHIKIKLFRYIKKPLVKFYKTYPNNPYLHFKIYDK